MYYIVRPLDFMKRFISILLCLSVLLGIFAIDVFAAGSQYYPVITYNDGESSTTKTLTPADKIGSWSYEADGADVFVISLPSGSEISNITIPNTDSYYVGYEIAGKSDWMEFETFPQLAAIRAEVGLVSNGEFQIADDSDDANGYPYNISYFDDDLSKIPGINVEGYMITCYVKYKPGGLTIDSPGIIVQYSTGGGSGDTTELAAEVSKVTGEHADDWYRTNDRYNGKITSANGFWNDLQTPLTTAQTIIKDGGSQNYISTVTRQLQDAIANLIPKTVVNATALYEAWQSAKGEQSSNYSEVTWTPFEAARTAAKGLLDKLYDKNGDPTELNRGPKAMDDAPEGAVTQEDVDAAAALLREKEAALYLASADSGNTAILGYAKKMFPALIALAEQAKQADYTTESWTAFAAALEAAKNAKAPTLTGTSADKATVAAYKKAFDDLYEQFYCGLTPAGEIKVSLVYTDPNDPHEYGTAAGARGGATETVTLDGSYSVYDAVQKLANKPTNAVWNAAKIFINGRYVSQNYLDQSQTEAHLGVALSKKIKLHPNDEVVVLAYSSPQTTTSQNIGSADAKLWQYISSLKTSRFTQGSKLKVEAGQQVTLNVQSTPAALGSGATTEAAANMTLMTSAKVDEPSGSHPTPTIISIDGNAVKTGADGSATLTFYHEGWYLVTAYDLQKDELGAYDASNVGTENRAGNYHSTNSGAAIWIQVGAASNPTAVKNTLTSKLTSVKNAYAESYFRPENWKKIEAAYKTAVSDITNAESIGDAYDAQQTGILAIKKIQDDTTKENEKNLKTFHTLLNQLPDNVDLITASVKSTVEALLKCYQGMSDYQQKQITGADKEKYDAIAAKYGDGTDIPDAKTYSVTVKMDSGDAKVDKVLAAMIADIQARDIKADYPSNEDLRTPIKKLFLPQDANGTATAEAAPLSYVYFPVNFDYGVYFPVRDANGTLTGNGWAITDENVTFTQKNNNGYSVNGHFTVKIDGVAYEIKSISYSGLKTSALETGKTERDHSFLDYSTYKGKNNTEYVNMYFPSSYVWFPMPYNDVTITVKWGKVASDAEKLAAAKNSATSVVEAAYNEYLADRTQYDDAGIKALNDAMTAFETELKAADTVEKVNAAKSKALTAMAAVQKKGVKPVTGQCSYDSGTIIGTVSVSVENTTYTAGDLTGTLVSGQYQLGTNDTMLTMVLKALEMNEYSWNGLGSITSDSYSTAVNGNYISAITSKDGKTLAEFTGGKQSGWMGTLNDWFVNEGLDAFSVKNGKLKDGDVIRVMYTTTGYGEDIGGSWTNTNTSLKTLNVTGGELTTDLASGRTDYVLVLPESQTTDSAASVKVSYAAANKNYQARMYLNTYKDETQRYKSGEYMSVTPGDVIYIGVGETAWPTMNTADETGRKTVPTKYTIQVIRKGSASDVAAMIVELPEVGQLTLADAKDVRAAGGLFDSLTPADQRKIDSALQSKLEKCRTKITDMEAANVVSQLLQSLPSELTIKDKETVHSANDAYNALTPAQKKYLTPYEEAKLASAVSEMSKVEITYVDGMLAALPGKDAVTAQSRSTIEAARKAYEELTDEQKKKITNLNNLLEAEEAFKNLGSTAIYEDYLKKVLVYVKKQTLDPSFAPGKSIHSEWAVLAEARGNVSDAVWYNTYLTNAAAKIASMNGDLLSAENTKGRYTEYSRVILALTSIGEDATKFTGPNGTVYNLVEPLFDQSGGKYLVSEQGNNGTAFALIALDSGSYYKDATGNAAREAWIKTLHTNQHSNGAWNIDGDHPGDNVDTTAMVVQALAPYYASNTDAKDAVDKAVGWLSAQYQLRGDYGSSESAAQVIVALSALGIDARTNADFQYKGISVLSNFLSYADETTGGFLHVKVDPDSGANGTVNQMASEQAAYTLVAYDRYAGNRNRLYDMSDVVKRENASVKEVINLINEIGPVGERSYNAIAEARIAYDNLSDEDQDKVTNYKTLTDAEKAYSEILKQKRADQYKLLKEHYDQLLNDKNKKYSTAAKKKLANILQQAQTDMNAAKSCERVTDIYTQAVADLDAVKPGDIEVTFRLIGALEATQDVDLTTDSYLPEYVTWVPTKTYALQENATVYDLYTEAMKEAGLRSVGADNNYVSTIYAPSCLGGYALSEFTNGKKSGWMYTVNGTHPNVGLKDKTLKDGDVVIWHYINDYSHEVADWFNDPNYPALGDGTYYNGWLRAADISPEQYVNELLGKILKVGKNGTVEPKLTFQHIGKSVTFTFKPDTGYKVKDVKVNGKSVGAVKTYTIDKLTVSTRIEVEFTNGKLPFTDVRESDWFYEDVAFAYENGLFAGTSDTTFSPNASMTRAMLVTVLYRLEGQPAVNGRSGFSDVQYNGYYEDAVTWAADNGIVNGTSTTTFSPNVNVTREQMAAILYRYAQYKKYNTAASSSLNGFTDQASVSGYAAASLEWAVAEKLVNGSNGKLMPTGNATRAQVAAILHRFVENVAKTTK